MIEKYIRARIDRVLKEPSGGLKRPYIDPGAGYSGELWDWDAFWTAHVLCACGFADRESVIKHVEGYVLNFLDAQKEDGYIPVLVTDGGLFEGYLPANQHKPFLCRAALEISRFSGDYTWFEAEKLIKYLGYYESRQFDARSGLFFWQDDIMIGVDNNPTVFLRPDGCCADIFLNSFLYMEYVALAEILQKLCDGRAAGVAAKAENLKACINREMWDGRDGIYYSQEIFVPREVKKVKDVAFHSGFKPSWNTFPLKIRFWGCFLPLYAGICPNERAERLVKHLTENDEILAKCGVRTLAKNEKMYNLEMTGNPSNWLGAAWTVADYCVYRGLLRYGFDALAEEVRTRAVNRLERCLKERGDTFESYHPDTGEPFLHAGFLSFNLLIAEMIK